MAGGERGGTPGGTEDGANSGAGTGRRVTDARLLPVALACWLTAGIGVDVPDALPIVRGALWAVTLSALVAVVAVVVLRRRAGRPRARSAVRSATVGAVAVLPVVALCAAGSALVAGAALAGLERRQPPALVEQAREHRVELLALTVAQTPVEQLGAGGGGEDGLVSRIRFRAELDGVPVLVFASAPSASAPAASMSAGSASDAGEPTGLRIGDRVVMRAELEATEPGDSAAFLVFGTDPPERAQEAPAAIAWAGDLRARFVALAQKLPGEGGELLPGLAVGDTSAVSAGLDADMKASSLSHLTAVSGANCAIVVAAIMLLGRVLGVARWVRVAGSLSALAAFVVLVTPEPSVVRAAVMAVIVMLAFLSGRASRGLPALCVAVIAILVWDPWLARSYGFALSALATVGLLVLAAPLGERLAAWMPRPLALAICVPLAAQLACQPVLVLLDPAIALVGVPANLLAGPAAPAATVLGLVVCLLLPLAPLLAEWCSYLAWLPSAWIAAVARLSADLPGARLPWLAGAAGAAVCVALTIALLLALLAARRRWRRAGAMVCGVGFAAVAGLAAGPGVVRGILRPAEWSIAACDIGQGDAVLLRDGARFALVDTGPETEPLDGCLDGLGVGRLDLVVLTHFDLDHVGGVTALEGRAETVLSGVPENDADRRMLARLEAAGSTVVTASAGMSGSLGETRWRVLWPRGPLDRVEAGNDASVVVEFVSPVLSSVFLGDLGESAQDALLATRTVSRVDVVKVSHHGSADQSEALYERLGAALGVISVGADNDYGHPTDRLLDLLARVGTAVARTDGQGLVLVSAGSGAGSSGELQVWSERAPP
ncbi:competence protein ComEC [Compostimonas suwonensis]|uniref:Competence protein ComEC n=2 Tax=Compostimonas suwonensis TaxID=1048394 RepID=A0A2M9BZ76_9MICO|nr:competence protein ComEC [Compostimonas suwonensis]